ncbi:DUF4350 domain-containing protein [Carboxylicivirga mesophila]|uniref:DUF4350 domain-containing protein n=1 Tax=Carboxylicivirga mesophila TaxID=1166478 RepID=A0ABS5K9M1_9BACT|nr:DUF4350 domain-containing protein [Carboxylicivirga mesophila]MBS2211709.1 DUF4350 domain-containing protein [Carboxylicivirga mesophila]
MSGSSSNRILITATVCIVLLVVFVLAYSPKPIDWSLSYSKYDTKPFGNKLLFELLPVAFDEDAIKTSHGTFDEFFSGSVTEATNLIVINNEFSPDETDIDKVIDLLNQGNNLFLSASSMPDTIRSLFKIDYQERYGAGDFFLDSISFNFSNRKLRTHLGYWYKKAISNNYFTSYDTLSTSVLGFNNLGKTNFIKVQYGLGHVFINLNPQAFTNYNLLIKDNYEYAFKCLSYLPNQATVWDEHYKYKYLVHNYESGGQRSILSFILDRTPLRIAWYVLLIGVLIFFLFGSARRQRAVPILKPNINSTVTFIETIGRLYYSRKNHMDIAKKRFSYLQEYIRTRYYINTSEMNDELYQQLADKSSIPIRAIKQLFELGNNLSNMQRISEEDLEQFNRRIDFFYEQCQ